MFLEKVKKLILDKKQFILYSIIGFSGAFIDFVVFIVLIKVFNLNTIIANAISISLGITNNFILNSVFNFKVKDKLKQRFIKFYIIGLFGFLISSLIIYVLKEVLGVDPIISKLCSIIIVVILQYSLNKRITFKKL
jgi:putative flippase GtrA